MLNPYTQDTSRKIGILYNIGVVTFFSVLVPKKLKRELENTIFGEQGETPKLHIFDRLQDFVFKELQRDFPLFRSSEHYKRVRSISLAFGF